MDPSAVEELIESSIPEANADVHRPRGADDDHLAAVVVSPAFDGETLVDQHQMVYDALDEHVTEDIHAIELKTYAPEERPD
jgi:stress-induced morphogen